MSLSISGFSPSPYPSPSLTSSLASSSTSSSKANSSTSLTAKPAETAAQQFLEYAKMTPAQRLHAEMLAQFGLTEDQFKALPPAQQQKINEQIAQMIKKQMGDNNNASTGLITDKSA
jgi:hypothetical protein